MAVPCGSGVSCVSPAFAPLKTQVTPLQPVLLEIKFSRRLREQKLSSHVLWLIILPTCILRVTNCSVPTPAGVLCKVSIQNKNSSIRNLWSLE